MFNPLMTDPSTLSDTELSEKVGKLLNRMNFFSRTGNSDSYQQCLNIYHTLIQEQMDRIQRNYANNEDQFGDLIDIPKK